MVVPVLITSCQVSEYPKTGPVASHTTTITSAIKNAGVLPVALVTADADFSKTEWCDSILSSFFMVIEDFTWY